jgi:hypothetical protein
VGLDTLDYLGHADLVDLYRWLPLHYGRVDATVEYKFSGIGKAGEKSRDGQISGKRHNKRIKTPSTNCYYHISQPTNQTKSLNH